MEVEKGLIVDEKDVYSFVGLGLVSLHRNHTQLEAPLRPFSHRLTSPRHATHLIIAFIGALHQPLGMWKPRSLMGAGFLAVVGVCLLSLLGRAYVGSRSDVCERMSSSPTSASKAAQEPESVVGVNLPGLKPFSFQACVDESKDKSIGSELQKFAAAGHNEFLYNFVKLGTDSVFLDIGGFHGIADEEFERRYHPKLYIFEPGKDSFRILQGKFPNAHLFNFGLGPREETTYLVSDGERSFVQSSETAGAEKIEIKPFSFIENLVNLVDVLFINCEGCEYPVLEALLDSTMIHKVKFLMIQFHKQHLSNAPEWRCYIKSRLRYTHTEVFSVTWVWEIWRRNDV